MSKVNIDQLYYGIANQLLQRMLFVGNKNIVGMLGFIIGLLKQGKLTDSRYIDYFQTAFYQELELDSVNHIALSDVCDVMPTTSNILDIVRTINYIADVDYAKLFEAIIIIYSSEEGRKHGEFYQPKEITRLVTSLLKNKDVRSVYNPFAGIASYQLSNVNVDYYSQEINRNTWLIGKIRLMLHDVKSDFMCEDSIELWKGNTQTFDTIIATPPFAFTLNQNSHLKKSLQFEHKYLDSFFIEKSLNSISENGSVIAVAPLRFLQDTRSNELKFKKHLVSNYFIKKVILLPRNIFYGTSISTAVVELTLTPNVNVMMVDGTSLYKVYGSKNVLQYEKLIEVIHNLDSKYVKNASIKDISHNNFNLIPSIYLNDPLKKIIIPDGFDLKRLGSFVSHYKSSNVKSGEHRLVRGKDLSDERFSFDKTFEELEPEKLTQRAKILDKNLLLLLRIEKLKPTLFHYKPDFEVCCNQNIFTLEINTDIICPQYLVNELSKEYISQQVTSRSIGVVMNSISLKELLDIKVLVPIDFDTQKVVYDNDKQNYFLLKARELGLEEVIEKMKSEYLDEIRMRKHDMKPYIRDLKYSNKLMKYYSTKELNKDFTQKFNDLMDRQKIAIDNLSKMIERLADEKVHGVVEKINIDEYFYKLEYNHPSTSRFNIQFDRDISALNEYGLLRKVNLEDLSILDLSGEVDFEDLYINMDPNDLDSLVSNIISNAEKHGFIDDSRDDYEIRIDLTVDIERNMFQIDFRNNGELLPKGLNKKRFGIKGESGGVTGDSGFGGFRIKRIVEYYGGDYDIFCEPEKVMTVTVRIFIPIFRDEKI
ncbi:MAG: N-6 DNA methylase [Tissierellia bacterium]|nr:N-6 DNA methylase [Tissierellia bacterium]